MWERYRAKWLRVKKYMRNFRACYYYLNKSVRSPDMRHALYLLVRSFAAKTAAPAPAPADLERLKRDGIIVFDALLDASTVSKISNYLQTKPVYNWIDADFKGGARTPLKLEDVKITKQTKLKYFDKDIAECREIVELGNSEKIISLVSAYLGCKPTITSMAAWWTKAGGNAPDKFYDDMFHRDADDYKFIKLFVYLNDVQAENGAHCFVKGSHLSKKCTERRTFSDEEIAANFAPSDRLVLTGNGGSAFLEDTWGLHRSSPCTSGERLMVQFLYSLTALNAEATPKPVAKNVYGVDAYTNRVFLTS